MIAPLTSKLTPRMTDIVRELLDGASNKEIGARLGLRETTMKVYFSRLFEITGCKSRTELALAADRSGRFAPPVVDCFLGYV
jgi:DNA-binding NarL/FixJ family response regulator